ncbi:MAG: LPS export ABC transporter periplasmic protein LptC [Colwellia sp.]|jgi:lipopolysaccharide export system protein LptC|uniref:LPS export ABC transporter periplasmic protein LptC n=1 Tax=unclassified Pseudoalteromonas TaxID=194690 RepID=UPI000231899D|nr:MULTISPECIES: LPS export ABC transporter periplasmic protein LptC [unclassified Pseudoalteromonas]MBL1386909.1 LPS export ABC transporter periplasmic protein LptC [Colwellia sp.]MCK8120293.1 LPS export ABC transporter periplasmic protein LptC [Pseudoalteromonas sp. 2CM32C]TMS81757.1 LPS export ABC transporter periplasmic protein LptC [Pseudoalteromonas sp. S554]GAA75754.1 lipopolysaccharide export system protein LptC [Pseudoalteromonas sp. BSi20480]|tara:strand:+ start:1806 stop:2360 length:555 start_codon:yes stop_codon:yes gene_type:complete
MNAARIILSVLFISCMVWLWYPYFTQVNLPQQTEADIIAKPDYTAIELKQTAYDENGKISHKVTAARMELYQELGFTFFDKPIFTLYNDKQTWRINANEATLYEGRQLILEGNVVASNLTDNAMIDKINADNIQVDIKLLTMQSEQPVIVTGPNLKITGKGLEADLKTEVIKLINHTRTIYYDQ